MRIKTGSTQSAVNDLRWLVKMSRLGEVIAVVGKDRIQLACIGTTYVREYGGEIWANGDRPEVLVDNLIIKFGEFAPSTFEHLLEVDDHFGT